MPETGVRIPVAVLVSGSKIRWGWGAALGLLLALALAAPANAAVFTSSGPVSIGVLKEFTGGSIPISSLSGTITDVNVTVNVSHQRQPDLDVVLSPPDPATFLKDVSLFSDSGSGAGAATMTFDDSAVGTVSAGVPWATGTYHPSNVNDSGTCGDDGSLVPAESQTSLAVLNGLDPNGTWVLDINDDCDGAPGVLTSWSIEIHTTTDPVPPAGGGGGAPMLPAPSAPIQPLPAGPSKACNQAGAALRKAQSKLKILKQGKAAQKAIAAAKKQAGKKRSAVKRACA